MKSVIRANWKLYIGRKNKMADNVPDDEFLNLSSPPKPTRIIDVDRKITPQRKEFVQSTSSLPALAGEVAVAQKNQVLRLEKRIEFLGKLRVGGRYSWILSSKTL